ncbi:MAG: HD domain-containing protein [Spirochaetales bacterium]|nr:HD domain-containing protein [Spirochaetales bacterium]
MPALAPLERRDPDQLLQIVSEIYHIRDLDTLLERVLLEARRFVNAEAGTIYLKDMKASRHLYFRHVQNDALFAGERAQDKYIYSNNHLEINKNSLAGYVALTGESLLIDDVYDIRGDVSYSFNPDFDRKTSYRTRSILVVPLETTGREIVGVLQLINARGPEGQIVPFSMPDRLYVTEFARNAANAIEKAELSQKTVLRMVEMAQLRDPYETSEHARRVGDYSVELYKAWARRHGVEDRKIKQNAEILRNAAMLHDVGKVALSDVILRKPGGLKADEFDQIRAHTIYGARLFRDRHTTPDRMTPWDHMAWEVALHHHERWDGMGYPGKVDDLFADRIIFGPGKKGGTIPFSARVVALADVYDALISKRSYKEGWKEELALRYVRQQEGHHFDPELVQLFLHICQEGIVGAIQRRYPSRP